MTRRQKQSYNTSYKEYTRNRLSDSRWKLMGRTIESVMSYIERMALGRFEWTGVDGNGIAFSRKIEEYLFYTKRCAIVDTVEVGLAVVKTIPIGINILGEPAGYDILTANGVRLTPVEPRVSPNAVGEIGYDNAIILTDSQLFNRGCIDGVWHWVMQYADAQITADQQMINQRAPVIGLTRRLGQEQAVKVMMMDVATGLNGLLVEEGMGDSVKALNLDSQFNIDKINAMQHEYLSRAMNSLGIDSMQAFGKKERLIVDEAESNDESLAMILSDCMKARRVPLMDNPVAEKYGITCELAKPYRLSTYMENLKYDDPEKYMMSEPGVIPLGKPMEDEDE